jgi:BASS family bile acid:Na+ symporter
MVNQTEQLALLGMLFVIMLGMGAALTPRDFVLSLKRPSIMIFAMICQFGFMPAIAFALSSILDLRPEYAIGLLIMGAVPGGTTSNIFSYFAKGNLALSVLMTVNSTVFAVVLTPFLIATWGKVLLADTSVQIPFQNIVVSLVVLLLPVGIGMYVRKFNSNIGALLEFCGSLLGVFFILFIVVSWVPRNWQLLLSSPWQVFAASIGLGLFGMLLGYITSRAVKIDPVNAQTIALEIGIQNGPLALGIVLVSFNDSIKNDVALMPALYSLFIVLSASAVTILFRKINDRYQQKIPALL